VIITEKILLRTVKNYYKNRQKVLLRYLSEYITLCFSTNTLNLNKFELMVDMVRIIVFLALPAIFYKRKSSKTRI
jgi:hypothetical protein